MKSRGAPLGWSAPRAALVAAVLAGCGGDEAGAPRLGSPGATPLDRPDTPGTTLQFRFDEGDVVETFGSASGSFLIHFARDGRSAVPATDTDASGVPDFVEEVAGVYDEVLVHYHEQLGFRAPLSDEAVADNGGDGRFDVYLVDFAGVGDGAFRADRCGSQGRDTCIGFMTQENDYRGYGYPSTLLANRILGSHEFFHAVQAAYDADQGSILAEGTAVWATESFDPSLRDFEAFIDGYLSNCDRSLDVPLPGPVDPFSYGSAIFFQFLEERYGQGTIRSLWERVENGAGGEPDPVWFDALDPWLGSVAQTTFADAFVEFATWNLFTRQAADPARGYDAGAGYPAVAITPVAAPYSDRLRVFYASSQYFRAAPDGRAAMTAALASPPGAPSQAAGLALLLVPRRGATYGDMVRVVDPSAGEEVVDVRGADELVVVVVNGALEGDSRKPTLCIGSLDEVAACRASVEGAGGGGGGGGGGDAAAGGSGGGSGGGDTPAAPVGPSASADNDGSCQLGAAPPGPGGYALGLSLLALSLRRRRSARAGAIPAA